jgi:hypothetical protein
MFGPGVEEAVLKYSKPSHELLSVLQLFGVSQKIIHSYEVADKEVIALDQNRSVIVKVPLEEEVVVRPEVHLNTT